MTHRHTHHDHSGTSESRIRTAFFLNLAFTVIEIVGGLWTNSISVLSDALHDLGDSLSLALSWRFARLAGRSGDDVFTFGYRRFSLLGGLVMGVILFGGGVIVLIEASQRLIAPEAANARGMLFLAIGGILVNGIAAIRMHGGRGIGERIVTWHFVEDVLGWAAVLIASIVMRFRDIPILDPILSIGIALYVLWNVVRRLKDTFVVLLQGMPPGMNLQDVEQTLREIPEVCDVHHTHVWSQDGEHHVLTAHIVIERADTYADVVRVRTRAKERLRTVGIDHATIEVESADRRCERAEEGPCQAR